MTASPERIIVTAALPYANGSLHLGHLVEYTQADIYVRALKQLGHNALYICASDTHGTPIELNAHKQGIKPEDLVQRVHVEQRADFDAFDISFDHFSLTHNESNRKLVNDVYAKLREGGYLEDREIENFWCETDERFLPDRFIRGKCPNCGTADQYGDVCESCNKTYSPSDLKDRKCALCGNPPVQKKTTHVFFKLSKQADFLDKWINSGTLQNDTKNYVQGWVDGGLLDWDITRDGPYFGFEIPDRPGKYFYVWLDAPLGYASSSMEWGEENGVSFDELWKSKNTRIEHIIGKDIVYFHTLFWPAVLEAVGFTLPSGVWVHGMLTVDGTKMSKSRGTFINAATFAEHVEPQALRYYYACKYGTSSDDLDLSFEDFIHRVNSELVNKHANLVSRAAQFLNKSLEGKLGDLPFSAAQAQKPPPESKKTATELVGDGNVGADVILELAQRVVAGCREAEQLYRQREFGQVMRVLSAVADIGNEFMQGQKPWAQIKEDPEAARLTCTFALNVCHALAMYLWPVVPRFAEAAAAVLRADIARMDATALFALRDRSIGEMQRLFDRIKEDQITAVVEASKVSEAPEAEAKADVPPLKNRITYDDFSGLDLRVGRVLAAEKIKKSNKLLQLTVDVGEAEPRSIVAGIAKAYAPEELVGSKVVVVANLAPAKLMGVESNGMVLAGGDGEGLAVLRLDRDLEPGTVVR